MGRLVSGLSLGPFVRREQEIRGGSGGSDCFFIGKAPLLLASFRLMSALPPSRFCKKKKRKGERGDRRCRIKPGKMGRGGSNPLSHPPFSSPLFCVQD